MHSSLALISEQSTHATPDKCRPCSVRTLRCTCSSSFDRSRHQTSSISIDTLRSFTSHILAINKHIMAMAQKEMERFIQSGGGGEIHNALKPIILPVIPICSWRVLHGLSQTTHWPRSRISLSVLSSYYRPEKTYLPSRWGLHTSMHLQFGKSNCGWPRQYSGHKSCYVRPVLQIFLHGFTHYLLWLSICLPHNKIFVMIGLPISRWKPFWISSPGSQQKFRGRYWRRFVLHHLVLWLPGITFLAVSDHFSEKYLSSGIQYVDDDAYVSTCSPFHTINHKS